MEKKSYIETVLVWVAAILLGAMFGFIMNDIRGIRTALDRMNSYNDASEAVISCYHKHEYCAIEWDGERYRIVWEDLDWSTDEYPIYNDNYMEM